jgi:hypothetical protein
LLHFTFANSLATLELTEYNRPGWVDATRKALLMKPATVSVEWTCISSKPICPRRFPFEVFN